MLTWVIEPHVFGPAHAGFEDAIRRAGHRIVSWDDDWWPDGSWPRLNGERVVFHGSLGNAARISAELPWSPGAFCNVSAFHCSTWYPLAREWLVQNRWVATTAAALAADPVAIIAPLETPDAVFVRPDSPLKPFSGRVLRTRSINLAALDHGFYYDDADLQVIIAPVRHIEREWRYVVVDRHVVAGSAYRAEQREALADNPSGAAWAFASTVAAALEPPDDVYTMDVCEVEGALALLELNPFSGADLYACDCAAVVSAIADFLSTIRES